MKIGIIDYGNGNIQSVVNALNYLKVDATITNVKNIQDFDAVVLPGVGAFKNISTSLEPYKKNILEYLNSGKPFLGICIGLQYLFEKSYENGIWDGLGFFKGDINKLSAEKLPQIGWNKLKIVEKNQLLQEINSDSYVYYINSYAADTNYAIATSVYGNEFAAVVADENVFGTQFHPEKSGLVGLIILKNFIEVVKNASDTKY
jgi:glutamine amidotransferase